MLSVLLLDGLEQSLHINLQSGCVVFWPEAAPKFVETEKVRYTIENPNLNIPLNVVQYSTKECF